MMTKIKFRVHFEMENGNSKYKSYHIVDAENEINAAAKVQHAQKKERPKYQFLLLKVTRV